MLEADYDAATGEVHVAVRAGAPAAAVAAAVAAAYVASGGTLEQLVQLLKSSTVVSSSVTAREPQEMHA